MTNSQQISPEVFRLRTMVAAMCTGMHCGTDREVEHNQELLMERFGLQGWIFSGVLVAEIIELFAPEGWRDITGAVHPQRVLEMGDPEQLREAMREAGMPPQRMEQAMDYSLRAVDYAARSLAYAHLRQSEEVLGQMRDAYEAEPEIHMATLALLLRTAADCFPCPRHGTHIHQ